MTDILFPFAKGGLYRESGLLNGYRPVADIFEDCRERELEEGLIDFIKNQKLDISCTNFIQTKKDSGEGVLIK